MSVLRCSHTSLHRLCSTTIPQAEVPTLQNAQQKKQAPKRYQASQSFRLSDSTKRNKTQNYLRFIKEGYAYLHNSHYLLIILRLVVRRLDEDDEVHGAVIVCKNENLTKAWIC